MFVLGAHQRMSNASQTNICIWTRTLVREVLDTHLLHEYADDSDSNVTTIMAKIANG